MFSLSHIIFHNSHHSSFSIHFFASNKQHELWPQRSLKSFIVLSVWPRNGKKCDTELPCNGWSNTTAEAITKRFKALNEYHIVCSTQVTSKADIIRAEDTVPKAHKSNYKKVWYLGKEAWHTGKYI